jgi:hypothetical protein
MTDKMGENFIMRKNHIRFVSKNNIKKNSFWRCPKMEKIINKSLSQVVLVLGIALLLISCGNTTQKTTDKTKETIKYPSDVIPSLNQWSSILCGDGKSIKNVVNTEHKNFFYVDNDGKTDWVVYKAPNAGVTTKTSNNTRTELRNNKRWTPKEGGKLTGTLKVMHVSTSGDARVAASYSVVVGQIHGKEGNENEPVKIFYKKFPDQTKGSVFWNYEINTAGDNSGRWDYSTAVWGNDMSVVGSSQTLYPEEPKEGIELGEEFTYEINVYNGIMYLTFTSEGHETKTFTKSLLKSNFSKKSDIPQQILTLYAPIGRDGIERESAYAGELQTFMQGAYNQTNGKNPADNIVWNTGSDTYDGDIEKQYANGCYAEVWFRKATMSAGTKPIQK